MGASFQGNSASAVSVAVAQLPFQYQRLEFGLPVVSHDDIPRPWSLDMLILVHDNIAWGYKLPLILQHLDK